jgi:hypothetical protein
MIEYRMTATCDGCGLILEQATVKVTKIDPTRWDWRRKWQSNGTLIVERMYKASLIYCPACADGVTVNVRK